MQKNTFKPGVHKGSQEKLRKRYVTALPDLIILIFIPSREAKLIEKMVLHALADCRQQNDLKNQSEWIQISLEALKNCVFKAVAFFNEFSAFHRNAFKQSKKRKSRETTGTTGVQNASSDESLQVLNENHKDSDAKCFSHAHGRANQLEPLSKKNSEILFMSPEVKNLFVSNLLSAQNPHDAMHPHLTRQFLNDYIELILQAPSFTVSAFELAKWLDLNMFALLLINLISASSSTRIT